MDIEQRINIQGRVIFLLFFFAFLFCLITPILDLDFFWHLATGRWIWEHKELPTEDPFSYTTSPGDYKKFLRAKIILTQYWLANTIQYGFYKLAGYAGIIGLRIIIILSTLLIVYMHLIKKRCVSILSATILLLPLSYVLIEFKDDRPNQMTFLFLAIFLYLLEKQVKAEAGVKADKQAKVKAEVKKKNLNLNLNLNLFLLPLLMLFWANTHGGFIIGAAIGFIYIISELIRTAGSRFWIRIDDYKPNYRLILITTITIIAGLLNHNGYNVIYTVAEASQSQFAPLIAEHMTPFSYIHTGIYRYIVMIIIFLLPAILSIIIRLFSVSPPQKSKLSITFLSLIEEIFLVIFFGLLSFIAIRAIPFLAIAVTPIIGVLFSRLDGLIKKLSRFLIPEVAVLSAILFFVYTYWPLTLFNSNRSVVGDYFPKNAVEFIKTNSLNGRLFNHYDWGGYLIWRFYPEKVVFIDGRGLSKDVFLDHIKVLVGLKEDMNGKPAYKAILDNYDVRNILILSIDLSGGILHLIPALVDDPEWRLIFYSKNCLLFTRDYFEPAYPKDLSYAIAFAAASQHMTINPNNPIPYLTIAKANIGLGRRDEAINILKNALSRRPSFRGGPVEKALNLMLDGKDILHERYGLP